MIPINAAAERLACSREHLMRLARRGLIRGAKIGRSWTFLEEDLAEFVRRSTAVALRPVKLGRRRNPLPRI